MVLWLPFDETTGPTSANLASTANPGTYVGGPVVVPGVVGNALSFNSGDQYVTVPDYPALDIGTNDFTIDAWVQCPINIANDIHTIVDKRTANGSVWSGYLFNVRFGQLLIELDAGLFAGDNLDTHHVPADDHWHLVAVTVQRAAANGIQFYIDGRPTSTSDPTGHEGSLANNAPLLVGGSTLSGEYWLGGLDEVEVYNRALSAWEVQGIFNAGAHGKCKPCLNLSSPTNKTVQCPTNWNFDAPVVVDLCCTNYTLTSNTVTSVSINPCAYLYTRTWQVTDCYSNTATCSQTVTNLPCPCQAFNTGMSNGVPLNTGATDLNFVLVSAPPGAGTSALVIDPSYANDTYQNLPDDSASWWIGPDTTDADEPAGVYHYQLQFLVCCTNTTLSGKMAADNLAGVYLNSHYAAEVPPLSPPCSSWTPLNVTSGFQPGLNSLDIYVTNWTSSGHPGYSSTGFRAELTNCFCSLLLSCPADIVDWSEFGRAVPEYYKATATNTCCGASVTVVCTPPSGSFFPLGTTPVSCVATDCCGNTASCSFTVRVNAGSNPTMVLYPSLLPSDNLSIAYPTSSVPWFVQATTNLVTGPWTTATNFELFNCNAWNQVVIPIVPTQNMFFRLATTNSP
jgi:hypothetical protein